MTCSYFGYQSYQSYPSYPPCFYMSVCCKRCKIVVMGKKSVCLLALGRLFSCHKPTFLTMYCAILLQKRCKIILNKY